MAATRGTNAWRLEAWGEPCEITEVPAAIYEGGPKCQINAAILEAFCQLGAVFVRHGYVVRRIGAYNCRKITGGTTMSAHAWGIAVDINDDTNPYRLDRLVTDMSPAMIADVLAIRTRDGVHVWRWGGNWDGDPDTPHSNYDAMHFEMMATPAELARGFTADMPTAATASTVGASSIPVPRVVPVRAWPRIRRGDDGDAVKFFQSLVGLERASGAGHFGPRTEAAAREYQRSRGLFVDGIVGLATWTALLTGQPPLAPGQPTPQKITARLT
jgi:hypothetical protein